MAQRTEIFDLSTLGLGTGEARRLDLAVPADEIAFGGERYASGGDADVRLDVARTTGDGYALRMRLAFELAGPCMRCLEPAWQEIAVDVREIEQRDETDEDLHCPYLAGDELDVRGWVRDSVTLAMPAQIVCQADCRGLCPTCGVDLNEDQGHHHDSEPDPRWAKLSELKLD